MMEQHLEMSGIGGDDDIHNGEEDGKRVTSNR